MSVFRVIQISVTTMPAAQTLRLVTYVTACRVSLEMAAIALVGRHPRCLSALVV